MKTFTVHLYADGSAPLRTEELSAADAREASALAAGRIAQSQTFTRARVYDGPQMLSEVGYRVNPPRPRPTGDF